MNEKGFTIIELMIASALFAVILLLISIGLLQIGRTYYKGLTSSYTQEVTRNIIEDISESIQLSGEDVSTSITPNGSSSGFCVGPRRYSYQRGQLRDNTPPGVRHAFVVDVLERCNTNTQAQNLNGGLSQNSRELMGEKMRISNFSITNQGSGFYQITVRVIFGDDDLLCSEALNDCGGTAMTNLNATDLTCRSSDRGGQFCSMSELTTTVQRRIQ